MELISGQSTNQIDEAVLTVMTEPRGIPPHEDDDSGSDIGSSATPRVDGFVIKKSGVYVDDDQGLEFVCTPLAVLAQTRDAENTNWGLNVEFEDGDGVRHNMSIPNADLTADGTEVCARLRSHGLRVAPTASRDLMQYLFSAKPERKIRCATRLGWHGDNFVLPDQTYGPIPSDVVYQPTTLHNHAFNVSGSVSDWQREIGALCVGNSRLVFAASCAFAAPLLTPLAIESGGFHYRGASSTGKTTALRVAGSVCGGGASGYIQSWRTTDNALELLAERHNDLLLCMDELSQIAPEQAGKAAYMLGNGRGKSRMTDKGGSQRTPAWNLLYLSTGEISLSQHVRSVGGAFNAGQAVRCVDIEADAGRDLGLFETLHYFDSAGAFAEHLGAVARDFYGAPLRNFIEQLVASREKVIPIVRCQMDDFLATHVAAHASGEVGRVGTRFALVAAAGELATEFGLTGWAKGEARAASAICFNGWFSSRGTGSLGEDAQEGVRRVRAFIEANPSRFECLGQHAPEQRQVHNRAGYKKTTYDRLADSSEVEYLFTASCFKDEVCKGLDAKAVARALNRAGLLRREENDETHLQVRVRTEEGQVRVYAVSGRILDAE